ncbi:MAG: group II intron reverse transcriptase domain-containing protein [Parcubacteria group bacterium]|nr:group II intron reverse transcriptase domain-containing protein [Parcubacteria group bacterium]
MSRIQFQHNYQHIISLENLLGAWKEFVKGKRLRKDVQEFERNLMANIISLHHDFAAKTYSHSAYQHFKIADPKPRDIHKASVRDRLLHHALHRELSPFFARTFIADSTSCQKGKGTHRALHRFRKFIGIVSENSIRTVWVLKCDIRKFFANINHKILLDTVAKYIPDSGIIWLVSIIVRSFHSGVPGIGLPLGNLTSQLLVNIYMNEFDQFVKHRLKEEHYLRYADDFAVLSTDKAYLETILPAMHKFLKNELKLTMHPDKVSIQTVASGVDFLGWVHFPDHRVLRTTTKKRMFRNIETKKGKAETVQSYFGLISHGNSWKLRQKIVGEALNFKSS